jgi:hypothetical protein
MKIARKTARINARVTPELKAFIEYLGERYAMENTEIIETAVKEYYSRQYATFKATK